MNGHCNRIKIIVSSEFLMAACWFWSPNAKNTIPFRFENPLKYYIILRFIAGLIIHSDGTNWNHNISCNVPCHNKHNKPIHETHTHTHLVNISYFISNKFPDQTRKTQPHQINYLTETSETTHWKMNLSWYHFVCDKTFRINNCNEC